MHAADIRLHLLAAMMQGVETSGAFLDRLPFKSKGQGRKRFALALKMLFPVAYLRANEHVDLYGVLRSHLSHNLLPGKQVFVHEEPDEQKHLVFDGEMLHISIPVLFNDYCCAVQKLLEMMDSGQLKDKKIPLDNMERMT